MVEGHSASKPVKRAHHSTASPIREPSGPYERNPLFDDVISSGSGSSSGSSGNTHTPTYNDRLNEAASAPSGYAADMDSMYTTGGGEQQQQEDNRLQSEPTNVHVAHYGQPIYLSGPMIIRVRPDGTPVEEDRQRQLPRDDDREAMTIGRAKLPTIQQITSEFGGESTSYRTAQRLH